MKVMDECQIIHRVVVEYQSSLTGEIIKNVYGPFTTPQGASAQANIHTKTGDKKITRWEKTPGSWHGQSVVIGTWMLLRVEIEKASGWERKKVVFVR
jgi:hypothetical protein